MHHPFFHHLGLTLIKSNVQGNPQNHLFVFLIISLKILPADSYCTFAKYYKNILRSSKSFSTMCLREGNADESEEFIAEEV